MPAALGESFFLLQAPADAIRQTAKKDLPSTTVAAPAERAADGNQGLRMGPNLARPRLGSIVSMSESAPGSTSGSTPGSQQGSPTPGSVPVPASTSGSGALVAVLTSRTVIAPAIVDLIFAMREPKRLEFRAGQFVSIAVGQEHERIASGGALRRSYSIASRSSEGERLRFIIRAIPEGAATQFLLSLPVGAEVRMTGPHGFFVLEAEHPGDLIFGATGTGVSAVMPMLSELGQRPIVGRRSLYWGLRTQDDLFARTEIEGLCREAGCDLKIFLTNAPSTWSGAQGRITPAIIAALATLNAPTFYLVGNGAMIAELKRELVARGINRKKQIRTEAFFD
jgi:CDP-4-dehydro-6-deoxyglucose reductase, E3